jgi:hypothetical protein
MRRPSTVSDVRRVYGLLSYYRKFIEGFSKQAKPISSLLKSASESITWTAACEEALLRLIKEIEERALILPDFTKEFILATDFSYEGISGVLS